jgi:hypothetical protein
MFNDIAEHYDAVLSHAGGTNTALVNANEHGITHYNVDSLYRKVDDPLKAGTAYRDKEYKHGEHNLFLSGPGIVAYAQSEGIQTTDLPERDYGLIFAEDGTPINSEAADTIVLQMKYKSTKKETVMEYDAEAGTVVAYSLGDLFSAGQQSGSQYSILLQLQVTRDNRTGETKITGCDYVPIYTLTPERDGEETRIVRLDEAIAQYESSHIHRVEALAYQNMKNALERIHSRVGF